MKKVTFSSNRGGGVRFRLTSGRDFGDLRYSLPTSLGQCIYRRMIAIGAYVHFLAFLTFLYGSNRFFTLYNMETK